jgi:PST family polysaccharide transporter
MLLLGTGVGVTMPFVRSVALAHLIAPEQLGLATALAVAKGFAETIMDIGLGHSAMRQGGDSSDPTVLATLQTIRLIRAAIVGALLALGGIPLASLFHAPEAAWSFSLLGLASFIGGFANMHVKEVMRRYVYGPEAIASSADDLIFTLVAVAAAFVLQDYRCMLAGILAGAIVYVVVTHVVSPVRWRLGWSRDVAREALVYGAPLMPNGIALALSGIGDRFLIGSLLGLVPLAVYNIGSMAAFMPRGIVLRLLMAVAVPAFINTGRDAAGSLRAFDAWAVLLSAISFLYGLSFLCFGGFLVGLVFGETYAPHQTLATLLAVSVYLKFMITLPTPMALAFGQTRFVLLTSVLAVLAVVFGAAFVAAVPDLTSFLAGMVAGELMALVWIVAKSLRIYEFAQRLTWFVVFAPIVALGLAHLACLSFAADDVVGRIEVFMAVGLVMTATYGGILYRSHFPAVSSLLDRFGPWRKARSAPPERTESSL